MIVTADGYLNFNTKINTSGFEAGLKNITGGLENLKAGLLKIAAAAGAAFSVAKIKSFADECKSLWKVQLEAETRLGAILKGNLGATDEQIQSLKDYASELQNIGVIGDEVQLSGLQELSTYIENADNLKPMMSVLTDMLAQQYGLNATAESAVTISTMLGKVLGGQTSALSRYGYFFDEAQEQLLKFGTEEQRVATLAEVVSASVGGVNEALAQTNAGRMQKLSNTIGDIKEQFGEAAYQIEAIFLPALNKMAEYLAEIATLAQKAAKSLASAFGIESDKKVYGTEMSSGLEEAVDLQESLTKAVEETEKAQEGSLAAFDKINTISSGDDEKNDDISADSTHTPIVTNLRENFKKAWSENEVGQRIIQGVLDIFEIISETVNDITSSTSEWAKNVDFSVFLESVDKLVESLEPLAENVGNGLEDFYNDVLLPLATWTTEEAIPTFLDSLSDAIDGVNSAWETAYPVVKEKLWDKFLKPIAEFTADAATKAIELLGNAIKKIGESITAEQVEALIDLAGGIGALILVSKGYTFLTGLSAAVGKIPAILAGLAPKIGSVITALGSTATLSLSTVFAGISAFIAGFSITTAILDWTGWDKDLEKFGEDLYDFFHENVTQFIDDWIEFWSGYGEYLYECGENLISGLLEGIADKISTVVTWLKENVSDPIVNGFKSLFGIHSPSTVMAEMGVYIIEGFCNGISDSIAEVKEIFEKVLEKIKSVFAKVDEWFKEKFQTAWDNITLIFKAIGTWFKSRWKNVKSALSEVGDWFRNKFQTAWDNVTAIFKGLGTWFTNRWSDVKSALSEVGDWFKKKFEKAWDNVTGIFSDFSGWFGEKWDKIKSVYSETGDFFREKFQSAWNNITEIFANPAEFFNKVWDGIKGCFSHVSDWFHDTFSEAWEKVKNVFSKGGEIFTGITDGIFETFKNVVNSLIDGINWVVRQPFEAINGALDGLRGIGFADIMPFEWLPSISIPEIPKLAQGTVVPANYGEFMAILGDNRRETEVVSPLSTIEKAVLNAMQKSGGNFPKEIVVNTYLYPNSTYFHREVIKIVDDDRRKRGG